MAHGTRVCYAAGVSYHHERTSDSHMTTQPNASIGDQAVALANELRRYEHRHLEEVTS